MNRLAFSTLFLQNGSPNSSLSLIPGGDETGKYNGSGIELNPVNQKLKKLLQEAKDGKPADEVLIHHSKFKCTML